MSLTSEQRALCAALGLSERLVEDAAAVSTTPCESCRQEPCVCTLNEFPFGMGEETELDAKEKLKLAADAREKVSKDVRALWNTKADSVTFYPATETPLKS
jgi:deoxycytidylate deaminase